MMSDNVFKESIMRICSEDDRYHPDSYLFVREALDCAVKVMKKNVQGPERHVTGPELLEAFKGFALQEFGPMASTVLAEWGIKSTEDVGNIVFSLVKEGRLGKTEKDSIADFKEIYDFDAVFSSPFRPVKTKQSDAGKPLKYRARKTARGKTR